MKKIIALAVILAVVNVQAQSDFTQTTANITFTNAETFFPDPIPGAGGTTNKVLRATYDGSKFKGDMLLQKSDGSAKLVQATINQAKLLKAYNTLGGLTMDASASNAIKKLNKAVEKAFRIEGNVIIDSGQAQ